MKGIETHRAIQKGHFANSEPGVLNEIAFVADLFRTVARSRGGTDTLCQILANATEPRDMNTVKVNGLENALGNIDAFCDEVIRKLRAIRDDAPASEVA